VDVEVLLIPVVAAVIGFTTNWVAVRMMFYPIEFTGVGRVGWQGVIPSRAARMGSIAVDKGLAKLGSLDEFYQQLDPERLAEHVVASSQQEVRALVERIVSREHPQLWADLPPRLREAVFRRVEARLPELVDQITHDIGEGIDQLMDLKLMVVRHLEQNPDLMNRMFLEVGHKEFRFVVNSGLWFGFLLGLVQMGLWVLWPNFWVLPAAGLLVGYLTNFLALRIIFEPVEAREVGPFTIRGLFLRRQPEVAEVYARLVTDNILTLRNLVHELLTGPKSDRTRLLVERRLRPAVDHAVGLAKPAVRLAVGSREYDAIQASLATEAVDTTMGSLSDPVFNRERAAVLRGLIAERMRDLSAPEFAELLRSAFREDEWQLIAVGAALGALAGVGQVVFIFGGTL
jgi:uncharacterized membrane protein YheB (UPF0754 family)